MNLKLHVFKRPDMFKVNENLYNMVGYEELKNLFLIEGYKTTHKSITLYYPERFLNVLQERALTKRLEDSGFENVDIVTHSVYIIQTVDNNNIWIYNNDDNYEIKEGETFKLASAGYYGLPGDSKLGVLGV